MNEELETKMEPDNVMDKYAVCVKKNTSIVVHLVVHLVKTGNLRKMTFNFLRADQDAECKVVITGEEVNLGDGDGMQVPWKLKISGPRKMVEILCKNIQCSTKEGKQKAIVIFILFLPLIESTIRCFKFLNPHVFANSKAFSFFKV